MRIVHVVDTFAPLMGGIEAQVARLAMRQVAAGHDVEVITTTPGAPGERGVTTSVERLGSGGSGSGGSGASGSGSRGSGSVGSSSGSRSSSGGFGGSSGSGGSVAWPDPAAPVVTVTVHRIAARVPGGWPVHPRSTAHVVRRLRELMGGGARPDVVHLHMGVLAPTVEAALRPVTRLGLPAVLTVHSVWGPAWRAFAAADVVAGWSRWPVLWSAVSELTAAPLRRIVGTRGEVMVLPNGLDLAEWRVERRLDVEGAGTGGVHVVSAARFAPRKRMLPLLGAVARAREALASSRRGHLRVTLAGDGAELARARRFVVEHGLSDVVSLPGALGADGLRDLYAGADVFAAPGVAEAFGIAALEAQAAGLAVLTRAGSGVAERVEGGVDGLIVPDDAALARALVRLATDHDLLHALVRRSSDATRLSAYDWPGVLAATEQAYARAAELAGAR